MRLRHALLPLALLAVDPSLSRADSASDPDAAFLARSGKLGDRNPKGWLELATWCESRRLWERRDEALRKVLALDPENREAHARLDEVKVGKAWMGAEEAEAAEAAEQEAKGKTYYGTAWVPEAEAEKLRQADRKAVGWPCELRIETPRLTVYSARPLALTRQLAATLEGAVDAYERLYGKALGLKGKPRKLRVFLFADHASFSEKYGADVNDPVNAGKSFAGIYAQDLKTLYLGQHPKGFLVDQVLTTAVHEMLHALDDQLGGLPLSESQEHWLWEGRAEYLAYSIRGRKVLPGGFHLHAAMEQVPDILRRAADSVSLRELMEHADYGTFRGEEQSLAWAFVHFLYHGEDGRYAEGLNAYVASIRKKSGVKGFERAVGELSKLEPAFRRYLDETFLPELKAAVPAR